MKKLMVMGLAAVFAMTGMVSAQNLLLNGDFALDNGVDPLVAASWTEVNNGGWVNRELNGSGTYGDPNNFHYAIGNAGAIDNNVSQNVLVADDGANYMLTLDAALDDWWSPSGFLKIEFLDAGATVLHTKETVFSAAGWDGAVAQPWSTRAVTGTAPAGTASITATFGAWTDGNDGAGPGNGGGTARFDNAVLQVIPEPATLGLFGLSGLALWIVRRRV